MLLWRKSVWFMWQLCVRVGEGVRIERGSQKLRDGQGYTVEGVARLVSSRKIAEKRKFY